MIIRKGELNDYFAINSLNSEELGYKFWIEDTKKQMEKIINNPSAIILVAIIEFKNKTTNPSLPVSHHLAIAYTYR